MRMRLGCSARASATPVSASVALSTLCPADSSRNVDSVMFAWLSSTTSTFAMSDWYLATRHCSTDLDGEMSRVEVGLLHDRRYVTIQLVPVGIAQPLGGDDEDRYGGRRRIIVKRLHHVETVYVGHQQVEHDQVGQLATRDFDPFTTAV